MRYRRELHSDAWSDYLDAVSRELLHAPVTIEVDTGEERPLREADRLALQAVSYDRRDDVFEVTAARGGPHLPSVVRHLVSHPRRLEVDSPSMLAPMLIAVDAEDGTRTTVRIAREPELSS